MSPLGPIRRVLLVALVPALLFASDPFALDVPIPVRNWDVLVPASLTAPEASVSSMEGPVEATAIPATPNHFIAITPCRAVDTRGVPGSLGGGILGSSETRAFALRTAPNCSVIPTDVRAYSVNVTVTGSPGGGANHFLKTYPTGETAPLVATLNYLAGQTVGNAAIVPAGNSASIDIFVSLTTHVVIDVNGYFVEGVVTNLGVGAGLTGGGTGAVALGLDPQVAFKNGTNVWTSTNTFNLGLSANGFRVTGVGNPTASSDAANKLYVDSALAGGSPGAFVSFEPAVSQAGTQGRALINLTQTANSSGSGIADLLSLRTNATVTSAPTNREQFRVDAAGGLLARGELGVGTIPMSGAGERMMWYPYRAAFRAGGVDSNQWDDSNIGFYSWAGGNQSRASAFASFAFGDQVVVTGTDAAAFGGSNVVSGTVGFSTGASNVVAGFAGVGLGYTTRAMGQGSVAIGYRSSSCGNYSVVLGHRATTGSTDPVSGDCAGTARTGSFVYSDFSSSTDYFHSTANNEFAVRAAGGFRFRTNTATTTGCNLPAGSGVFSCTSDRNEKNSFHPLDGDEVLRKIAEMPIETWSYNSEPGVRHAGPSAQDFNAAFGLGVDDRSIGLTDINGIALKAVQALEQRTRELAEKTAELEEVRARLDRIEQALARNGSLQD